MIDVSVVIVTYNSSRFMRACLPAVKTAAMGISYEVLVVDNASSDDTLAVVAEVLPAAQVIRNDVNSGFAGANNQGIEAGRARYVMLLNPDTVAGEGSISTLVSYMDSHPRAAIAGPRLHGLDGGLEFSQRNFPSPGNQLFESLFLHRIAPRLSARFGEVVYDPGAYGASHGVGWISGAAMLLRPEAIAEIGALDERFFMYSEEKDLCYRAHLAGWGVDFVAESDVTHGHDGLESPEAFARQLRSKMAYFDKHYRGLKRLGCKVLLGFGLGTRVAAGVMAAFLRSERRHQLLLPLRGVPIYLRARARDRGVAA